jgi:hypothetical protein
MSQAGFALYQAYATLRETDNAHCQLAEDQPGFTMLYGRKSKF